MSRPAATRSSGEGADAIYDGASKSDFAVGTTKASSNFAAAKPRFADKTDAAPDVDVATRGIGDINLAKPSSSFATAKPRFQDAKVEGPQYSYEAGTSDFDKAARNTKPSFTSPEKEKPRGAWMDQVAAANPSSYDAPGAFNVKAGPSTFSQSANDGKSRYYVAPATPDVEVHTRGIGDVTSAKPSSGFAVAKPRFQDAKVEGPQYSYEAGTSDFDKAARNTKPSFTTPEKEKPRGAWMDQASLDNPSSGNYEAPGAFNVKASPSTFANSAAPRFKDTPVTYGEPTASVQSDFAKAAASAKPSAHMMAVDGRFKNETPSYGDPGALQTNADIERMKKLQAHGGGFHS